MNPRDRQNHTEHAQQEHRAWIQKETDWQHATLEVLVQQREVRERAHAATKEAALAPSSHKSTFIPTTAPGPPSISAVIDLHETTGKLQPTMPGHTSQPTWDGQDAQDHSLLLEFNEPWAHNHASHDHTSISAAIDLHETTGRLQPTMPGHASQLWRKVVAR